jgi:hypothetical protein
MSTAETIAPQPVPRRDRVGAATRARLRAIPAATVARAAFILACAAAVVGFFVYPTYPNYDSIYSLIWGRELLHLEPLTFEAYRAPTEHPLAIAFGALMSLLGRGGDRVMLAFTIVSFLVLVWGVYRLGRVAFTPLVGGIAALLLLTRLDFAFLAVRGYIDIPFLALIFWAAALEAERPRRGLPVMLLLAGAGLLRPEAWLFAGLYFLWIAWPASWPRRAAYAALTAAAPVAWAVVDWAVTRDPLFSLHSTSELAGSLGRQMSITAVPRAAYSYLMALDKAPVLALGVLGFALVLWLAPRRLGMPAALLFAGLGTFLALGVAGMSVIQRYMLVPSLAVMVFAAVALGGWTMLREGHILRRAWALVAAAGMLAGVYYTASHANPGGFEYQLRFRGQSRAALLKLVDDPAVRQGMKCGPISLPNHKLVPDVRWLLDLPADRVIARSEALALADGGNRGMYDRMQRGVAIYPVGRQALLGHSFSQPLDSAEIQVPLAGFEPAARTPFYVAYVRC